MPKARVIGTGTFQYNETEYQPGDVLNVPQALIDELPWALKKAKTATQTKGGVSRPHSGQGRAGTDEAKAEGKAKAEAKAKAEVEAKAKAKAKADAEKKAAEKKAGGK